MALRIPELSKLWLIPNAPQAARAFSVNVVTGFSSVAPSSAARGPGLFCLAPLLKNSHSFKGRVKTFPVPFLSSLPLPFPSPPPPSPSRFEPCLLLQASFIFRTSPTSLPSSFPSNPRNQGTMIFFVLFAVFLALASASPPMTGAPGGIADAAHTINDCDYGTYEVPRRFTLGPPTGIPTPQGLTTRRGQNQAGQNSGWGQRPRGSENGDSVVDFGLVILEDARLGTR